MTFINFWTYFEIICSNFIGHKFCGFRCKLVELAHKIFNPREQGVTQPNNVYDQLKETTKILSDLPSMKDP